MAMAALERVQTILRKMESDSWEYVPRMIEKMFYVRVPEARKQLDVLETVAKHLAGYQNAAILTGEQHAVVDMLVANLMGEITDAALMAMATVQSALIGRVEPDVYRRVGLEQVAAQQAAGTRRQQVGSGICGGAPPGGRDRLRGQGRTELEPAHLLQHGKPHHIPAGRGAGSADRRSGA